MIGVITTLDILAHPVVTIQCFGWRVFFKAFFAGRRQTFLSLLPKLGEAGAPASRLSNLVDRCVELELRAKRIYIAFAHAFVDWPAATEFFGILARQEQNHADLLALCSAAARRGSWVANVPNPWEPLIPCLDEHFQRAETALAEVDSLEAALRLVIQIESGEINRLFETVLASCDVAFVKRVAAFRRAVEIHVSYIADRLPELDPSFLLASRELRGLFPRKR